MGVIINHGVRVNTRDVRRLGLEPGEAETRAETPPPAPALPSTAEPAPEPAAPRRPRRDSKAH